MKSQLRVLVADDDHSMSFFLSELMKSEGHQVLCAYDGLQALEMALREAPDVALLDVKMPGLDGLEVLRRARGEGLRTQFIVITAFDSREIGVEAIRLGAFDYFPKPLDKDEVRIVVKRAAMYKALEEENLRLKAQRQLRQRFGGLIGQSAAMQALYEQLEMILDVPVTVLITGESGTGKELVAEAIHFLGPRREKPFVKINCVAIPDTLLESELFGHEKGAFTGATERKLGRFERANGGSVLLDEIGDMGLAIQAKLLRFLQEHALERLGGVSSIPVDVRVMAATNQDLPELVRQGRFREDLYYRLNVVSLRVPPLRERTQDIPLLAEHFLDMYNRAFNKEVSLSKEAMEVLLNYRWPGNVRELENTLQRAVVLCKKGVITPELLPESMRGQAELEPKYNVNLEPGLDLNSQMERLERELISQALAKTGWRRQETAQLLGITRQTLHNKMMRYGLASENSS
ncbi:MAG: sigma-54 dependent transcriptional regulator [bacterium]